MNMDGSAMKGLSLAFVKEVNARIQALHEYSDQHGVALPPDLIDGVQQLNRQYRGQSEQLAFSANVSSVSDKSGVSKSPPIPFDLKDLIEDGSVARGQDASLEGPFGLQEEEEEIDLSFASSAWSTESKKAEAKRVLLSRKQELKDIRRSTKSVQQQIHTRVRGIRTEASQALEAECRVNSELTYYQSELERMKEAVGKMLLETSKTKTGIERARDSALDSAVLGRRLKGDSLEAESQQRMGSFVVSEQLKEMQRELSDLHQRIRSSEVQMRAKDLDTQGLKTQVGMLEKSLGVLGSSVQIDQEEKSAACSDRCALF